MSDDTRELRAALEAAQAEARTAREHETEKQRLAVELEQARRELSEKQVVLDELTRQVSGLAERSKDDAALQSELRRLRAAAEVGLSARQRYERSRPAPSRPAIPSPQGTSPFARGFAGLMGSAFMVIGVAEGRLHPVVLLACGASLCLWAAVSGAEN